MESNKNTLNIKIKDATQDVKTEMVNKFYGWTNSDIEGIYNILRMIYPEFLSNNDMMAAAVER